MEKKKAVAYIRVSDVRQLDGESPETQREKIEQYAKDNNIEIVPDGWFFDQGKSAKNADREELKNLLSFALKYKGKIDHVIVYKMSRASRDMESYYTGIKALLKSKGITLRSATEHMVDDTTQGRFMEGLLILLAQMENDGKSDYTVDNMRSLAEQGYWQHPPVVGYEMAKIANSIGKPRPTLKPNAMAPKVRDVLERFSLGDITKAELVEYAASVGLQSRYGKKIGKDSLNRLLKNPVYAGYISDKFTDYELIEGKHLGLISKDTYERNMGLLYGKNTRKGELHIQKNKSYPLKGLVLCWNCSNPLYASAPKTGNGGYSPRYHCARKSCKGIVKSVKAQQVHDDFELLLKRIKPSDEILKLYKTVLVREAGNELNKLNQHIASLREELTGIDLSRINVIKKFTDGLITIDDKDQVTDSLTTQKLEIAGDLSGLEQQQNIREADIELAIGVMEKVDEQWIESQLDVQVRFQNMLFPDGLVYDSVHGKFGTSSISPLYRCISTEKGTEVPLETYLVAGAGLEPATSWL
jgi:site-specific DNA recombinase